MPKTMLVADDSVVIQKSIGITFAQEDFAITYVNNGDDALAKAKQLKPDVILADIVMPRKNGYEVCEAIRKDPQLANTPVILLTGSHEPYDEPRGRSVGATDHVIKPFESQALIERIKTAMSSPSPAAVPAGTIAGQMPRAATPVRTPSPASTIAGQATSSRDAPMLDLDPSAEAESSLGGAEFDFGLEETQRMTEPPLEETTSVTTSPSGSDSVGAKGGDEGFWDLTSETTSAEPTVNPSSLDGGEFVLEEPAAASQDSMPREDFGFDPSAESTGQSSITDGATAEFDLSADAPSQSLDIEDTGASFGEPIGDFLAPEPFSMAPAVAAGGAESAALPAQLSEEQIERIVTKVFEKVIERIAWEVVPDLAETIIKEELSRLTKTEST